MVDMETPGLVAVGTQPQDTMAAMEVAAVVKVVSGISLSAY